MKKSFSFKIDLLYFCGILELLAGTWLMWGFESLEGIVLGLIFFHMGIKDTIDPLTWISEVKKKHEQVTKKR